MINKYVQPFTSTISYICMYARSIRPYNPGGGGQSFSILVWDESRLYEDYYNTYGNFGDLLFSLEDTIRLGLCLPFLGVGGGFRHPFLPFCCFFGS